MLRRKQIVNKIDNGKSNIIRAVWFLKTVVLVQRIPSVYKQDGKKV